MFDSLWEYKNFSSHPSRSIVSNGHGILYPEIKQLDRQFEHAVPLDRPFKVKNVWRCISTSNLISIIIWYSNWLLSILVYTSFRNSKNKTENKVSFLLI